MKMNYKDQSRNTTISWKLKMYLLMKFNDLSIRPPTEISKKYVPYSEKRVNDISYDIIITIYKGYIKSDR